MTYVRKAIITDVPQIMHVIEDARRSLAKLDVDQWQGVYPSAAVFEDDIAKGECYVLICDDMLAGVATLQTHPDPDYACLIEGAWALDEPYTTIHRLAIHSDFQGRHLADIFLSYLVSVSLVYGFNNVRMDTHRHNKRMQHIAAKHGFVYRGVIPNDEYVDFVRIAFEWNAPAGTAATTSCLSVEGWESC